MRSGAWAALLAALLLALAASPRALPAIGFGLVEICTAAGPARVDLPAPDEGGHQTQHCQLCLAVPPSMLPPAGEMPAAALPRSAERPPLVAATILAAAQAKPLPRGPPGEA